MKEATLSYTATPTESPTPTAGSGWLSLVAVTLGALMPGLATTILAVANASIADDLHIGLGDLQWITSSYLIGLTASLVLAGKLGDRFGRRRVFLIGIAGFGLTSLIIGFSTPVVLIITLRAAQGIFGGFLTTNALSLLRVNFPERRLPAAIGIFNSVQGLSIAAGPVIGGVLVQSFGWRSTMFINVPIAIVCFVVGIILLREVRIASSARFDYAGTILLVGGLTTLVYALIDAPTSGWASPITVALLATSVIAFVLFVLVERRAADPLVPLSLFRDRSFSAGAGLSVLAFFALNGSLFLVTLFWLQIQGVPATTVGVWVLPLGLSLLVGAVLSARIIPRIGDRWSLFIGCLLLAAGMAAMSLAQIHGGYLQVAIGLALVGLGLGLLVSATVNATVGNAPIQLAGPASGVQQTATRFGAALGVAVLGGFMAIATSASFSGQLDNSALPIALTRQLRKLGSTTVAGGVAPIPPGLPTSISARIQSFTDIAFLHGMTTTMLISAAICVVGALVALIVRPRAAHEEDAGAVEAEHPYVTE